MIRIRRMYRFTKIAAGCPTACGGEESGFVWAPKYRKKILSLFQDELRDIFFQIAEEYDLQIIEMEIMPDHIHILLSAPPRFSPARIASTSRVTAKVEL
ncbi:IS200/IS605 family transposase [Candidatus Poribacteria bacterium]|nr:IS200/IS605 family transposase [Candidatus Poribacteria bacterium]